MEALRPFALALARDRLRRAGEDPNLAEDLVQEVFTSLWTNQGRIDPALGARSYVAASVIHAVHRHLRGAARRRTREEGHRLPSTPEAPDEPLLRAERVEAVEEAMAILPPEDQLLLRWIYWEGLSYAQAAVLSGKRADGMGMALTRARGRLKEALEMRKKGVRG